MEPDGMHRVASLLWVKFFNKIDHFVGIRGAIFDGIPFPWFLAIDVYFDVMHNDFDEFS